MAWIRVVAPSASRTVRMDGGIWRAPLGAVNRRFRSPALPAIMGPGATTHRWEEWMADRSDPMQFKLAPGDLGFVGKGLNRPECVLATASGDLYVSHARAGVTRILPDGSQRDYLGPNDPVVRTNGFCLMKNGDFLAANLEPPGGVWRITRDGGQEPFLMQASGRDLPTANFVMVDREERVWATFSTWRVPRSLAYRPDVADGFIVLVDRRGARIVSEGIGYTNEAIVDPSGEWLYINETMGRRTTRARITADGLGPRELVTTYGHGNFPDGLCFDAEGGLWMTSVVSNRIVYTAPDRRQHVVVEEVEPAQLEEVEAAYQAGIMGRQHLDSIRTRVMKSLSSMAFGGPDLRTGYLGNLLDDRIYSFRTPVAGLKPVHWDWTFDR